MDRMGQRLFDPPSVAGWAGGRSWINTSTLFVRQNLAAYLLTGRVPFGRGSRKVDTSYDPMFLIRDLPEQTPEAVVDHLVTIEQGHANLVLAGLKLGCRQHGGHDRFGEL